MRIVDRIASKFTHLQTEAEPESTSARIVGTRREAPNGPQALGFNSTIGVACNAIIDSLPAETKAAIVGGGGLGWDPTAGDAYTMYIVKQGPKAKEHQAQILDAFKRKLAVLNGYGLRVMIRGQAVAI